MIPALIVASVGCAVIALLCWRLSRAHLTAAAHCECIAAMLREPQRAEEIARANRDDLIERGLWRSTEGAGDG